MAEPDVDSDVNISSIAGRPPAEPPWYADELERRQNDATVCCTVNVNSLNWGPPLEWCAGTPIVSVLLGCAGERLEWTRVCERCLRNAQAGLHVCVRCPERHAVQVLQVRRDGETEVASDERG